MNMPAVGLSDLGNMFGAFHFLAECEKANIKGILGCEFYVSEQRLTNKFTRDTPDKMTQQVLLAKNKQGYHNLVKLCSLGYSEGMYGLYPRVDKALIQKYKENIIALSGSAKGEIPDAILNQGEMKGEEVLLWWKENFGEDFYIEIIRNKADEKEQYLNNVLLKFAHKHNIKIIAANEIFYLEKEDVRSHEIMLCIRDGETMDSPTGTGRGKRFVLPSNDFYFKSSREMEQLFADIPEAIHTIQDILDKTEKYVLQKDVLLPKFDIPKEFDSQEDYLQYLTYEGAKKRYPQITPEIEERLTFELEIIKRQGYAGYFLIVEDFISYAKKNGVWVGPGRGSAAGSLVVYCIGITNIDPLLYGLLFERFLNPDRVSMPDMDIDFDDEGRDKVFQYVISKYGKEKVAQIITYGSMATKSSIRDCARVLNLASEAESLSKLIPEKAGITIEKAIQEVKELDIIFKGNDNKSKLLQEAKKLEGTIRNTGVHACGVIISPDEITNHIPTSVAKDAKLSVTQFDNEVIEKAGMLKMDFLGLTTLSIMREVLKNIQKRRKINIHIDDLPLNDTSTYKLFQQGLTNGIFQFESAGMQKYLKDLKPDNIEDLIAMNALYRPGPIDYIPSFIERKHGREPIKYEIPDTKEILEKTYGITVYQEQVMILSQKLASFTKGQADSLRKAMGKKIKETLDKLKPDFIKGCKNNGYDVHTCEKIWKDWEKFAEYAFNKSHAASYAILAYQTAYLKANFTPEYMAALLSYSSDIENISFFIEDCKNFDIKILGPHINESQYNFTVNEEGSIRFGIGSLKGAGEANIRSIIEEREKKGHFKDIWDFAERTAETSLNKKTIEALAKSGSFDCFTEFHRKQYLEPSPNTNQTLVDIILKYAQKKLQETQGAINSLFSSGNNASHFSKPKLTDIEPYTEKEKLDIEKEILGLYITGHPLDMYHIDIQYFCNTNVSQLSKLETIKNIPKITIACIVQDVIQKIAKTGNPYNILTIEDYTSSYQLYFFTDQYNKFQQYFVKGAFIFIEGKVQNRYNKENEIEFRVTDIHFLEHIREKLIKNITITLNLSDINHHLIEETYKVLHQNKGKYPIRIVVKETTESLQTDLIASKLPINMSNQFISQIKKIPELQLFVNT